MIRQLTVPRTGERSEFLSNSPRELGSGHSYQSKRIPFWISPTEASCLLIALFLSSSFPRSVEGDKKGQTNKKNILARWIIAGQLWLSSHYVPFPTISESWLLFAVEVGAPLLTRLEISDPSCGNLYLQEVCWQWGERLELTWGVSLVLSFTSFEIWEQVPDPGNLSSTLTFCG